MRRKVRLMRQTRVNAKTQAAAAAGEQHECADRSRVGHGSGADDHKAGPRLADAAGSVCGGLADGRGAAVAKPAAAAISRLTGSSRHRAGGLLPAGGGPRARSRDRREHDPGFTKLNGWAFAIGLVSMLTCREHWESPKNAKVAHRAVPFHDMTLATLKCPQEVCSLSLRPRFDLPRRSLQTGGARIATTSA